jgi:hypothetical protein
MQTDKQITYSDGFLPVYVPLVKLKTLKIRGQFRVKIGLEWPVEKV